MLPIHCQCQCQFNANVPFHLGNSCSAEQLIDFKYQNEFYVALERIQQTGRLK